MCLFCLVLQKCEYRITFKNERIDKKGCKYKGKSYRQPKVMHNGILKSYGILSP